LIGSEGEGARTFAVTGSETWRLTIGGYASMRLARYERRAEGKPPSTSQFANTRSES
jgi:hypothetical protein